MSPLEIAGLMLYEVFDKAKKKANQSQVKLPRFTNLSQFDLKNFHSSIMETFEVGGGTHQIKSIIQSLDVSKFGP